MMHFKPNDNYNPKDGKYYPNGIPKKDYVDLFRKWYAIVLSPMILGIHTELIPIWLAILPQSIIIIMAFFIALGLYRHLFVKKIFQKDLTGLKTPLINFSIILEIFGYSVLSLCLFYVGWTTIFYVYFIPIVTMTSVYIFLLARQYDQLRNKH